MMLNAEPVCGGLLEENDGKQVCLGFLLRVVLPYDILYLKCHGPISL